MTFPQAPSSSKPWGTAGPRTQTAPPSDSQTGGSEGGWMPELVCFGMLQPPLCFQQGPASRVQGDSCLVCLAAPNIQSLQSLQSQAFCLQRSFPAPRAPQTSLFCSARHRFWVKCILIALKSGRKGLFFASAEGMGAAIFATGVTPLLCARRGRRTASRRPGGGTPSGGKPGQAP